MDTGHSGHWERRYYWKGDTQQHAISDDIQTCNMQYGIWDDIGLDMCDNLVFIYAGSFVTHSFVFSNYSIGSKIIILQQSIDQVKFIGKVYKP